MDFIKSLSSGHGEKAAGEGNKPGGHGEHHQNTSTTELLSSAKVLADAAKSAASNQSDKIDKGKAAGAAADLLDAGKDYGKLGEKGVGGYVHKAGDYLHQYEAKNSGTGAGHAKPAGHGEEHKPAASDHHDHVEEKKSDHSEGGGAGDYFKAAQGFLKKN